MKSQKIATDKEPGQSQHYRVPKSKPNKQAKIQSRMWKLRKILTSMRSGVLERRGINILKEVKI